MTGRGSDTYTYDYEDRLIQSSIGGVVTQYSYDGLGNRLERVEGGTITRYVLDINGSLSNVIAETDGSRTITAYYVYGFGLISKVLPDDTAYYYHYDSRGSTITLTDTNENMTDKYAYDPFGRLANSEGTTDNPFKYVGRYGVQDEGNGLQYIRARYYTPELGRFITKDPLMGNDNDGQSLNRYVYALNNPVVLVDISGLSPLEISESVSSKNSTSDLPHKGLVDRIASALFHKGIEWGIEGGIIKGGGILAQYSNIDPTLIGNFTGSFVAYAGTVSGIISLYRNAYNVLQPQNITWESLTTGDLSLLTTDDWLDVTSEFVNNLNAVTLSTLSLGICERCKTANGVEGMVQWYVNQFDKGNRFFQRVGTQLGTWLGTR